MTVAKTILGLIFVGGLAFATPAFADEPEAPLSFWAAGDLASQQAPNPETADTIFSANAAMGESVIGADEADESVISLDEMQDLAGGEGVAPAVLTVQNLTAINSGNTVSGVVVSSGQINIDSSAFSNFNGVGNFVLNTGHNNNLQSSLSVSIVLGP